MFFQHGRLPALITSFILLLSTTVNGQRALPAIRDTGEIKIWLDTLRKSLNSSGEDQVRQLSTHLQQVSQALSYHRGQLQAAQMLAQFLIIRGRFDAADSLLHAILPLAERHQLPALQGAIWNNIAIVQQNTGRVEAAANAYLAAADAFEKAGNKALKAAVLGNLGATFLKFGDYSRSRPYLQAAADLNLSLGDSVKYAYALLNLAIGDYRSRRFVESGDALHKVATISRRHPEDIELRFGVLSNQGEWHLLQQQPQAALQWHRAALTLANEIKAYDKMALQQHNIALCYFKMGEQHQANTWINDALHQADQVREKNRLLDLYQTAATIKAAGKHWNEAFTLQKKYQDIKDEVQNEKVQRTVTELEIGYQNEQKNRQIAEQSLQLSRRNTDVAILTAILVFVLMGIVLGVLYFSNQRRKQQVALLKATVHGEERERNRLARELHDGLGGLLAGVTMQLRTQPEAKDAITLLQTAQSEVRRMAHNLLPDNILREGLVPALHTYCSQWNQPEQGIVVQFIALHTPHPPPAIATAVFRMTQELLHNAIRHGNATEICVQLGSDNKKVSLTVEDNGKGFDPSTHQKGVGLLSVKQRTAALQGSYHIQSTPGAGVSVHIEIPFS